MKSGDLVQYYLPNVLRNFDNLSISMDWSGLVVETKNFESVYDKNGKFGTQVVVLWPDGKIRSHESDELIIIQEI